MNPSLPPLHWLANKDIEGLNSTLWKLKKSNDSISKNELLDVDISAISFKTAQGYSSPHSLPVLGYRLILQAAMKQNSYLFRIVGALSNNELNLAKVFNQLPTFQFMPELPATDFFFHCRNLKI